jgi:hypothetical protein
VCFERVEGDAVEPAGAPPDIFLRSVGIIFAQTSLDSHRAYHFRPCSVTVLRMGGQPISQLASRTRVGDSYLLEERSCLCPLGGRREQYEFRSDSLRTNLLGRCG